MKSLDSLRIVFIGTPDFAVASLDAIVQAGLQVVAVVTVPDKPAGRGMKLQMSPVKQYALENDIPVLQPEKLKDTEFVQTLREINADLHVVVAFRMLPEVVWNMPPLGTINVHGSLLPQYRGAAPINWAIINGEVESGVTTFKLKHEIDTGDILLQKAVPILPDDNAGTLHDKLMAEGAALLVTTIKGIASGTLKEIPQNSIPVAEIRHAPKIFNQHKVIVWDKTCIEIHNLVRGLAPYPAAVTVIAGKSVKVFKTHFEVTGHNLPTGSMEIIQNGEEYPNGSLRFAACDGWVYIDELQQEGKKAMDISSFLRGFRNSIT